MEVLITGGAGFIGSHLADAFAARGDRIVLLDDFSTGRRENVAELLEEERAELIEGSTLDHELVASLVAECDLCFHLASAVGVELVVERPLESLIRNVRGADNVTQAAALAGARLVFASTSEIYGKQSDAHLGEDSDVVLGSPQTARWGYAVAKMVGEMLAYGYGHSMDAEMTVVRFFNTAGARQTGAYGMVVPRLVAQALAGDELTVYGDGTQTRCFGHVADAVDALLLIADADGAVSGRPFNVGNPRNEISIRELAEIVIERTGSDSAIRYVPYDEAFGEGFEELGRRRPDTSALEAATGWRAQRGVEEIVDEVVAHQRYFGDAAMEGDSGTGLDDDILGGELIGA